MNLNNVNAVNLNVPIIGISKEQTRLFHFDVYHNDNMKKPVFSTGVEGENLKHALARVVNSIDTKRFRVYPKIINGIQNV